MGRQEVLEAALIALGMVTWPILGKYSQAPAPWIGLIVMGVSGIVAVLMPWIAGSLSKEPFPAMNMFAILAVAGILNGIATSRYAQRARLDGQTGTYLVLVAVLIVIQAPFVDMLLNRTALNLRQWGGVGCGLACVYLLGMK